MGFIKLSFVLVLIVCSISCASGLKRCQVSPRWRLSNHTFPSDFPGNVKLVAFLKSSCGFCINQSQRLDALSEQLNASNMTQVSFVIVNSPEKCCLNRASIFRNLGLQIPVLQDIPKVNLWKLFAADVDDMLIFDKCNRLVLHMKLPDSMVHLGKVRAAIERTYNSSPCGSTDTCPAAKSKKRI